MRYDRDPLPRSLSLVKVSARELARHLGRYSEASRRGPIAVTRRGQPAGYFIAPEEFAAIERLKAMARKAYTLDELPEEIVVAIGTARMDPRHEHLNALLYD
jgi:PHD/YefM family antitoxin component YafN of YafNO toxin-antitoxin module